MGVPCLTLRRVARDNYAMRETMGTTSSIGCKMPRGKVAYVECRYDGGLAHVGLLLAKHYNDYDKALELLLGGDIVSLREDPSDIVRKRPKGYDGLEIAK